MKVVFLPWPSAAHYLQIVPEDMALRSAGQIGSLNLRSDVLAALYYKAFLDLSPGAQDKVREQVQKVVNDELALRAIAARLTS